MIVLPLDRIGTIDIIILFKISMIFSGDICTNYANHLSRYPPNSLFLFQQDGVLSYGDSVHWDMFQNTNLKVGCTVASWSSSRFETGTPP